MLAAAASPADPGFAPHDLGKESFIVAGAGQVMPVAAMIAEDDVPGSQMLGQRYASPFLSDTCVNGSEQATFAEQLQQPLLKHSNAERFFQKPRLRKQGGHELAECWTI